MNKSEERPPETRMVGTMTDRKEDENMYNDYFSNEEDKNEWRCAICGYEILAGEKHDPRPIVSNRGEFCCSECNEEVVVPTRKKVWTADDDEFENELIKKVQVLKSEKDKITSLECQIKALEWVLDLLDFYKKKGD